MGAFVRFIGIMTLLSICVCIQARNAGRCPPPSWIKPTRTCISDKECYPGMCCPDYLGRKSCALPQRSSKLTIKKLKAGHCPPPSWIKPTRTCLTDKECYPGICCPDYLGRKSCDMFQLSHRSIVDIRPKYCNGLRCDRRKNIRDNYSRPDVILV